MRLEVRFGMPHDASKSSDHEAHAQEFVRLLGAHEQALSGYIISLVPNWADADEIAQDTKLRLWEQFAQYDRTKDFGTWARAIAFFMVMAYRKRSSRAAARLNQQFVDLVSREASLLSTRAHPLREALSNCVAKLDQAARELLWACYSGRETIKDIAIRLGRTIRGTQRAVARIRNDLQQCVEDAMHREELR
jgi:RNA polymerase sigma-70 factor, ECF subfamily